MLNSCVFIGTATDYRIVSSSYPPDYEPLDPRSWRDSCNDRTCRLADFLSEWTKNYQNLEWIAFTMNGWPHMIFDPFTPEEIQELKVRSLLCWSKGKFLRPRAPTVRTPKFLPLEGPGK